MVSIAQGDVWWAELGQPTGSGPGFRRPVVVVQGNSLNRSRLATVVCVPLTSNLAWADAPGNVLLRAKATGLTKDSVANVSSIVTLDRSVLTDYVGRLSAKPMIQNSPRHRRDPGPLGMPQRAKAAPPRPRAGMLDAVHVWHLMRHVTPNGQRAIDEAGTCGRAHVA